VPVALVTGATRHGGIGAAIALELARNGWDVATTGFRRYDATEPWGSQPEEADAIVEQVRSIGARAAFHEDDLADPSAASRVLRAAEAAVGPVTALVNNHAHSESGGLLETTPEQLDRHWQVNARAAALLMAEFARRFQGEPATGRIVNLTSGLPLTGELAYAASKGALEWLTISAAAELAARGIAVNAVDPGPTDTGWMSPTLAERIRAESPLGRLGRPEDAARLVAFLCSPDSGWVTGQVLSCDGGWSTLRTLRWGREPIAGE
jgi:3-oxoacyl-[acyl-carrier protein] reductase